MQEAIPYLSARRWSLPPASNTARRSAAADGSSSASPSSSTSSPAYSSSYSGSVMRTTVAENSVVLVGARDCFMRDVARRLLLGLGVNPAVCEVGEGAAAAAEEAAAAAEEAALLAEATEVGVSRGDRPPLTVLPVVFVGGRLLGGIDRLVTAHITGDLVPILKDAGALWL